MKTKLVKSAGRFGARYGQHIRKKLVVIEERQRKKQVCPFCNGHAKRASKGIWECKKCKRRFAAHTYFLEKDAIKVKQDQKEKPSKVKKTPLMKKAKPEKLDKKKVSKKTKTTKKVTKKNKR